MSWLCVVCLLTNLYRVLSLNLYTYMYLPVMSWLCFVCLLTILYRVLSLYLYSTYLWWADYVSFVFWPVHTKYFPMMTFQHFPHFHCEIVNLRNFISCSTHCIRKKNNLYNCGFFPHCVCSRLCQAPELDIEYILSYTCR